MSRTAILLGYVGHDLVDVQTTALPGHLAACRAGNGLTHGALLLSGTSQLMVVAVALIHKATLAPSKLDLLTTWLPDQPWCETSGEFAKLGSYRFDDPLGEVGLEAFLLETVDGSIIHVPLTYRDSELPGAGSALIGTAEHSVLGTRWVYDGCADPVWVGQLATVIVSGGTHADAFVEDGGQLVPMEPSMTVRGSGAGDSGVAAHTSMQRHDEGDTTVIRLEDLEVTVVRTIGAHVEVEETLVGRWSNGGPAILAGTVTV